jgi:hypothetical protein
MKHIRLKLILSLYLLLFAVTGYGQQDFPLTGVFLDTLKCGENELRLVITIERGEDGYYSANFNSIDQGRGFIAFDEVILWNTQIELRSRAGIQFKGEYTDDYSKITGEFSQGTASFLLEFIRVEQVPMFNLKEEPGKPLHCRE